MIKLYMHICLVASLCNIFLLGAYVSAFAYCGVEFPWYKWVLAIGGSVFFMRLFLRMYKLKDQ